MATRGGKPPFSSDPLDEEQPFEQRESDEGATLSGIPEIIRRAFAASFSGFFLTEEVVRKALGDAMPREWSEFANDQSRRARAEFLEMLGAEVARALEGMDYAQLLSELLDGRTVELKAEIRLRPSGKGRTRERVQLRTADTAKRR